MARIVGNRKAIRALLKLPEVLDDLERRAEAVARRAGTGHFVDSGMQKNRARAAVITGTYVARRAEAERRNLTRAFDAARGDR